jgi:hypothetical protein
MSGLRDIEDLVKDFFAPVSGHGFMPASEISGQIANGRRDIFGRHGVGVRHQAVLRDQPDQMFAISDQALQKFLVQFQILRSRTPVVHALFLVLPEKFDFVKPQYDVPIKSQLRVRAQDDLARRTPASFGSLCLHQANITSNSTKAKLNGGTLIIELCPAPVKFPARSRKDIYD